MSNAVRSRSHSAAVFWAIILLTTAELMTAGRVARADPLGPADILAREIAPGVFIHEGAVAEADATNRGDIATLGFVVGTEAVAVIDTGGSAAIGRALREAVRRVTPLPIRYVINTHMHPDHVLGNAAFADDKPAFIGHAKLARALAARAGRYLAVNGELIGADAFAGTVMVAPTMPVADALTLDLGGRRLRLQAWPTAHTDNDLTVLDEKTGTLFAGDLVFIDHIPTLDGSLTGWLATLDTLEHIPARIIVPGHGPAQSSWAEALAGQRRYLRLVARDIRAAISAGRTMSEAMEQAGQSEAGRWALFQDYHRRNVAAAFAELEWQ